MTDNVKMTANYMLMRFSSKIVKNKSERLNLLFHFTFLIVHINCIKS